MKLLMLLLLAIHFNQQANSQIQKIDSVELKEYFLNGKVKIDFWVKIFGSDTLLDGKFMEFYENGKISEEMTYNKGRIVGVREFYDRKGRVIFRYTYNNGDFPRTIISQAYYYDFLAGSTYSVGTMIETGYGPMDYQQHGNVKYFRRNGSLMDSVVIDHNVKKYRARFNNKGKLVFEEKY